jgi:hypothetical protein
MLHREKSIEAYLDGALSLQHVRFFAGVLSEICSKSKPAIMEDGSIGFPSSELTAQN